MNEEIQKLQELRLGKLESNTDLRVALEETQNAINRIIRALKKNFPA